MTEPGSRWDDIKRLFFEAQDLHPDRREQYIRDACGQNAHLVADVVRLLHLNDAAGSFLEQPVSLVRSNGVLPEPLLPSGELIADRYLITALIGRGGMGDVYEARDQVIDDVVALKLVRPNDEPVQTLAARWRREAVLARRISHRGVCRVHDVAIHHKDGRELLLLTMERLHGESLATRLRRGRLSTAEALEIARQMAAALDAAHAHGILHRDIKPDNILLEPAATGTTRVVLMDFGLARNLSAGPASELTQSGWISGTPGYVAPELLHGAAASPQSDQYGFAMVVRNMLDGVLPLGAGRLGDVFTRSLSVEPANRYPSASAFVDELSAAIRRHSRPFVGWRRIALTAAVLVALLGAGYRYYIAKEPRLDAASEVLLTDMLNGTGDREFDGATELLRSQLAQSPHFDLVDAQRIRSALQQMRRESHEFSQPEVAREIAWRAGAPLVVYSSVSRLGQEYTLAIKLEIVGPRPSLARRSWDKAFVASSKNGIFDASHDAAVWIRQMVGETPASIERQDRPPSDTTTSSWEALQLYSRANVMTAPGQHADAALLLEDATRIDPEFAMAQMRLGDRLIALKRDKDGYEAWERAIRLLESRQLTTRETFRIRGQYLDDTGALLEAEKTYRAYALHYPNDFDAAFLLGGVLVELKRGPEAVRWLERARALRPESLATTSFLIKAFLDDGRTADADRAISELDRHGSKHWSQWFRALSALVSGQPQQALAQLEPLRVADDPEWRSRYFALRAAWLSELGRDHDAVAELRAGIAFDESAGLQDRLADKWLSLAELEWRLGIGGFAATAHRALETASNVRRIVSVASILLRAGDRAGAERLLKSLDAMPRIPRTEAARATILGHIRLAEGAAAAAVEQFDRGFAMARRRESRLPLARALIKADEYPRAESLLRSIVEHPVWIYSGPEPQAPGLWRAAITELVNLVGTRDVRSAEQLRQQFVWITPEAVQQQR